MTDIIDYHRKQKQRALDTARTLSKARHTASDKLVWYQLFNKAKERYKRHRAYKKELVRVYERISEISDCTKES